MSLFLLGPVGPGSPRMAHGRHPTPLFSPDRLPPPLHPRSCRTGTPLGHYSCTRAGPDPPPLLLLRRASESTPISTFLLSATTGSRQAIFFPCLCPHRALLSSPEQAVDFPSSPRPRFPTLEHQSPPAVAGIGPEPAPAIAFSSLR
jgi:hypothetical protein